MFKMISFDFGGWRWIANKLHDMWSVLKHITHVHKVHTYESVPISICTLSAYDTASDFSKKKKNLSDCFGKFRHRIYYNLTLLNNFTPNYENLQ